MFARTVPRIRTTVLVPAEARHLCGSSGGRRPASSSRPSRDRLPHVRAADGVRTEATTRLVRGAGGAAGGADTVRTW
jgi:hypothetical protein